MPPTMTASERHPRHGVDDLEIEEQMASIARERARPPMRPPSRLAPNIVWFSLSSSSTNSSCSDPARASSRREFSHSRPRPSLEKKCDRSSRRRWAIIFADAAWMKLATMVVRLLSFFALGELLVGGGLLCLRVATIPWCRPSPMPYAMPNALPMLNPLLRGLVTRNTRNQQDPRVMISKLR